MLYSVMQGSVMQRIDTAHQGMCACQRRKSAMLYLICVFTNEQELSFVSTV
jgi:hypothetical protein